MIRVVFFNYYSGLGGGETSLLTLLRSMDRKRYTPILICPREGQFTRAARESGIDADTIPYRGASVWFVPSLWASFSCVRRIKSLLVRLSPAIVHSDFHSLPYVLPVCRDLKIPLVFGCSGWWFHPRPWQQTFYRDGPKRILALSESIKQGFLGDPPFMSPDRVDVLYPGVDTTLFHPRPEERDSIRMEFGLDLRSPLVTLVARFQRVKAHDVFLTVCRLVQQGCPEARFAIAGDNAFGVAADDAFKQQVLSMISRDSILQERVTWLGWVSQPERLLAASDVVVCSSHFESFGMVLIEAMASEVPVVSTNVGGPAETIVDGQTGYLAPPRRPDLVAERVLALLADEKLRNTMGSAGRKHVIHNFSLERYVSCFSETLDSLLPNVTWNPKGS